MPSCPQPNHAWGLPAARGADSLERPKSLCQCPVATARMTHLGASNNGIRSLTVWRPGVHTQGVVGPRALWRCRGRRLPASSGLLGFQVLQGSCPHPSNRCLCRHVACPCVAVSKHPTSCEDTSHAGFRAHPDPVWHHLNLILAAKTLFPNKVTLTGSQGTLFSRPISSKLGLCWTSVPHRTAETAPPCRPYSPSGSGTPEAPGTPWGQSAGLPTQEGTQHPSPTSPTVVGGDGRETQAGDRGRESPEGFSVEGPQRRAQGLAGVETWGQRQSWCGCTQGGSRGGGWGREQWGPQGSDKVRHACWERVAVQGRGGGQDGCLATGCRLCHAGSPRLCSRWKGPWLPRGFQALEVEAGGRAGPWL